MARRLRTRPGEATPHSSTCVRWTGWNQRPFRAALSDDLLIRRCPIVASFGLVHRNLCPSPILDKWSGLKREHSSMCLANRMAQATRAVSVSELSCDATSRTRPVPEPLALPRPARAHSSFQPPPRWARTHSPLVNPTGMRTSSWAAGPDQKIGA